MYPLHCIDTPTRVTTTAYKLMGISNSISLSFLFASFIVFKLFKHESNPRDKIYGISVISMMPSIKLNFIIIELKNKSSLLHTFQTESQPKDIRKMDPLESKSFTCLSRCMMNYSLVVLSLSLSLSISFIHLCLCYIMLS